MTIALLDMKKTNGSIGDSTTGVKHVDQLIATISLLKLGLKRPKNVGRHRLALAFGLVANGGLPLKLLVVFASEWGGRKATTLREWLVARANDFGQDRVVPYESDHMPVACDVDSR
jgi:hypothetical protein